MMVSKSTNINKVTYELFTQIIENKKDHYKWHRKYRTWVGTGTHMWRDLTG
jgi:hypothetical protein